MSKIVLTRNFKNQTSAKYCAAEFGIPAKHAVEIDNIELENVEVTSVGLHSETRNYENFGCGTILIGEGQMPVPAKPAKTGLIEWTGWGFRFMANHEKFDGCKRLLATSEGMTVLA